MYGKRIRDLREENNMTQRELAEVLHVSQRTLSRFELEQHDISTAILISLTRIFHVSADYILGIEDETGAKT